VKTVRNTISALERLADSGQPGSIEYYRGHLIRDREGNPGLGELADTALRLAQAEKVLLFQQRYGPDDYGYIARRSTTPLLKFIAHCAGIKEPVS
jgi:hypothetical protein